MRPFEEDFDDLDFADSGTMDRMMRKKRKSGRRHASHSRHGSKYMGELAPDLELEYQFDDEVDDYNAFELDNYSGFVSRYHD